MKFKNLTQKNFILKILEQFVKTNPFLYKFAMILNSHILRNFFPESDFTGLKYINFPKKKIVYGNLVEKLRNKILEFFDERMKTVTIRLDYQHSRQLANIYEWSRVDKIDYQEEGILMTLTTIPGNLDRLRHQMGVNFTEMN